MKIKSFFLTLASAFMLAGASQAQASVVVSSAGPVTICDLCIVTSTVNVTSHFTLSDVNVRISNLVHSYDSDLYIQLISPTGTTVVLSANRGGSSDNFTNTVFDDEALQALGLAAAPFNGTFRPDGLLSAFDGQDAFGIWTLRIADQVAADSGRLNNWGLELTAAATNVPEPASLGLAGLALAAMGWARRRRQA